MKKYYIGSLIIIASLGISAIAVAFQSGILINTSDGGYLQNVLPIGQDGSFLMADHTAPGGMIWQMLPVNPFTVSESVKNISGSSTQIITMQPGYQLASTTVSEAAVTPTGTVQTVQTIP